jgi:diaminohydroxyphosphoribosylaminopyrimidine deaminase/5-amino-6-(5-phosphoribosylamino)uracil reductase
LNDDEYWMEKALELARRGQGYVEPNPMVGCVVVRKGELISSGFHERFGGPHAEVNALRDLDTSELTDATLYVTLEPCAHHGKTPPCVDLVLSKRPKRVVVAMQDPFEYVSGGGISRLIQSGIEVTVGVLEAQAKVLNAPYLKRIACGLPWVIAKWAMTLDGAIASSTGDSKWISNDLSRKQVHQLRARVDAIIVGSSTVIADDPLLTARLDCGQLPARRAVRVVLDRRFRIGETCQLVRSARDIPVMIAVDGKTLDSLAQKRRLFEEHGIEFLELGPSSSKSVALELDGLLRELAKRGATNVLVEGGAEVLGSFFDAGLVDQVECYIAPKVLGGALAHRPVAGIGVEVLSKAKEFQNVHWESLGGDLHFSGFLAEGL